MPVEIADRVDVVVEPPPPTTITINSSHRLRILELLLVMGVAFSISIFASVLRVSDDIAVHTLTNARLAYGMCWESLALSVLAYVVFRQGRTWIDFTERPQWRDLLHGIVVIVVAIVFSRFVYYFIQYCAVFATGAWIHPKSLKEMMAIGVTVLSVSFMLLNPFFEELIVRAYLMTEVSALSGSRTAAIIVSTAVQASYHLYQGWLNAAYVTATFLVFSVYYAKARRIGPVIIAHMFFDITALLAHRS